GNASGPTTLQLDARETRSIRFSLTETASYELPAVYSNDKFGPLESVEVRVDGSVIGSFNAQDTGDFGFGWNNFLSSGALGRVTLGPGAHAVTVTVTGGDGFGVEIDFVGLTLLRPLEVGTVTNY